MKTPIVCFSHGRWRSVFQRPNHIMARFARDRRVLYIEEPVFDASAPRVEMEEITATLTVCTPHWPDTETYRSASTQARLVTELVAARGVDEPILWFYTPMALPLATEINASVIVYDCTDEVSLSLGAPKELLERENALLERADVVFTGGHSRYDSKRGRHPSVHAFPCSVDVAHFTPDVHRRARDPEDQRGVSGPRVGFFGVIDERMDWELVRLVARERPMYQFVFIGPVERLSEHTLPRVENIHYLGPKTYQELPHYLRGWDVAILPFALNDATRSVSPTRILEYLAGGKPVVSTAVGDVIVPYVRMGVVRVADRSDFAVALDEAIADRRGSGYRKTVQGILRDTSWEKTWREMSALVERVHRRFRASTAKRGSHPASTRRVGGSRVFDRTLAPTT